MTAESKLQLVTLSRCYALEDSLKFAEFSGDYNPLHTDPLVARRTTFGKPVVHGIHLVIEGLKLLARTTGMIRLTKLKGSFLKPVLVGDDAVFAIRKLDEHSVRLTVDCDGQASFFDVFYERLSNLEPQSPSKRDTPKLKLVKREVTDIANAEGQILSVISFDNFEERFPELTRLIPQQQLTDLISTSTLVGMECPGEFSLYSRFRFTFSDDNLNETLKYQVTRFDERFRMACMSIEAPSLSGEIVAFVRPRPTPQISMKDAMTAVDMDEFKGIHALVIGGSRGLGETTAKLLAAGGASITLTYARGRDDALRVKQEIAANGANAEIRELDVTNAEHFVWKRVSNEQLSLFYFATPAITRSAESFSINKFQNFIDYYVVGLNNLLEKLQREKVRVANLFAPSTIFLDHPVKGMAEYAAAKATSEVFCQSIESRYGGMRVATPRWPKMETDQTASMVPETFDDPKDVVLASLRLLLKPLHDDSDHE